MARVSKHTRVTASGKRVTVKAHSRRQLSPEKAWGYACMAGKLGHKAWKATSKKRRRQLYTAAAVAGTVAAAQFGAWSLLRGTGVVLTGVALAAAGGVMVVRRLAR